MTLAFILPFAYPWVLLFLVLPVALGIWKWRRAGHPVVLPLDDAARSRHARWLYGLLNFGQLLPVLLFALVIMILAGPQQFSEPKTKRVLTNIQFALDVSGSMMTPFGGEGNRYDSAMAAVNGFLGYREGDAFGLTVFGDSHLHWIRLTSDPSAFKYATPFLRPERLPRWFQGGTAIGNALERCLEVLVEREEGDRMIILVSDGQSADLFNGRDEKIARELAANNITVFGIHVAEGEPPAEIATIASITGGAVFSAGDPAALDAIFKRIDEMVETKLVKVSLESMDDFKPWAFAALCVGGLHVLFLLLGIRYTPW
jgi:Ca-activated chloride channel family protein